ncbi:MAG: DUF433 domain-containing protein [Candidatus Saliniplasma sp.]
MINIDEEQPVIVSTEGTVSGSPRIAGTRVRVIDVVESYQELGWTLEKIADQYSLDMEQVIDALRYCYRNMKRKSRA